MGLHPVQEAEDSFARRQHLQSCKAHSAELLLRSLLTGAMACRGAGVEGEVWAMEEITLLQLSTAASLSGTTGRLNRIRQMAVEVEGAIIIPMDFEEAVGVLHLLLKASTRCRHRQALMPEEEAEAGVVALVGEEGHIEMVEGLRKCSSLNWLCLTSSVRLSRFDSSLCIVFSFGSA